MGLLGLTGALLGMLAGRLRGGRLRNLEAVRFQWLWLLVAGFAVQLATTTAGGREPGAVWVGLGNVLSFALYVAFAWFNRRLPGLPWILAGAGLNLLVIALNGGKMPVVMWAWVHFRPELLASLRAGHDPLHVLAGASTRLPWLADYLLIPGIPSPVFSPGDLLIAVGAFLLLEGGMRNVGRRAAAPGGQAA
ncbi:MAG: DUF5317 domain-containing protein [Firmicutes bacterium]|nr:DUF5317 domain-containing protein [Bacillota bacterium]